MAHCNDKQCTRSSRYEGSLRFCDCSCETCALTVTEERAQVERGTCESCGARVGGEDEFCDGCGATVTERAREGAYARRNDEIVDHNQAVATISAKVSKASRMIGLLAILFAVSGVAVSVLTRDTGRRALANLANYAADETLTLEGKVYKVAELRARIEAEPTQLLIVNLLLAAIMLGLYVWSRKSPLPAITTALAVFVGVTFISFLMEPTSLFQGIIIKIAAIAALTAGLRSALAARDVARPTSE